MKNSKFKMVLYIAKLLLYYVVYQVVFTFLAGLGMGIYSVVSGNLDINKLNEMATMTNNNEGLVWFFGDNAVWVLATGLFLSALMMLWHLVHFGYFKFGKNPLQQVKPNAMVLSILLVFSSMFLFNIVAQWFELPDNLGEQMKKLSNNVLGVLSIAVLAPLLEEVLFRGAIQGYLMRKLKSPWVAIIIASLIFGVIHMNPIQIFYATMLGFVLGWIYYRTGSLIPVVIGHVLNNSLATVSMIMGIEEEQSMEIGLYNEIAVVVIATIVSIIIAILINRKQPSVPKPWHAAGEDVVQPEVVNKELETV